MSTSERLFEATGRVVWASQTFEFIFGLAVLLAVKQAKIISVEEITPVSLATSFKAAVKNRLQDPAVLEMLGAERVERISKWVERRHRIIHRKMVWPGRHEADKLVEWIDDCTQTEQEALGLSAELTYFLSEWVEKFPESEGFAKIRESLVQFRSSIETGHYN